MTPTTNPLSALNEAIAGLFESLLLDNRHVTAVQAVPLGDSDSLFIDHCPRDEGPGWDILVYEELDDVVLEAARAAANEITAALDDITGRASCQVHAGLAAQARRRAARAAA